MEKRYVEFNEVVELFLNNTIREIQREDDVPNVNFIFPPSAFKLFEYVRDNPFVLKNAWTPNIEDKDIERVKPEKQNDLNVPTIYVNNPVLFFELLAKLSNSIWEVRPKYFFETSPRALLIHVLRRAWLRMAPRDFSNVEKFLERQIAAINDQTFDEFIERTYYTSYEGYRIIIQKDINMLWDESAFRMKLSAFDNQNNCHSLPSIYYEIVEEYGENICYIGAVQNPRDRKKVKQIERTLYKLNKGVEEPDIHPSSILSLRIFFDMLKSRGISKVKFQTLQVLSHPYHRLLGDNFKKIFEQKYPDTFFADLKYYPDWQVKRKLEAYSEDKEWYSRIVGKADEISERKVSGLTKMAIRMDKQFSDVHLQNLPFTLDEEINITLDIQPNAILKKVN